MITLIIKELIINEEELVKQCLKKERRAQENLYNHFYADLYRIAMRYLSDHHDTEDAIILSFTKIFKNLKKFTFQGPGSLGRWIRTILINESIRLLQKRKTLHFDETVLHISLPNDEANGLDLLQAEDLLQIIAQLPTGYRTVFNLYVIEGYPHKEIANLLGISENTSKTQLKKARTTLMNRITKEKNYGTV